MQIIDAQLHEFGPRLKWENADDSTRRGVLTEVLFAWMDATGVDAALLFPGDDAWGEETVAKHSDRLAGVFLIRNPETPDIAERIARVRDLPGAVGVRLIFGKTVGDLTGEKGVGKFRAGVFEPFFTACEKLSVPLFVAANDFAQLVGEVAKAHPTLRLIVDHMGIAQPPLNARPSPPWKALPELLALGKFANIAVKLDGAPVLSDEPYPFRDVWPHLHQMLESFGADRMMWATDINRFRGRSGWDNHHSVAHGNYPGKHTYADALSLILHTDQLTESEKELILGGTVRSFVGWPKPVGASAG